MAHQSSIRSRERFSFCEPFAFRETFSGKLIERFMAAAASKEVPSRLSWPSQTKLRPWLITGTPFSPAPFKFSSPQFSANILETF